MLHVVLKLVAVLCPPLAVLLVEGITTHVLWNVFYTLCLYLPGMIDALVAVGLWHKRPEARALLSRMGSQKILFIGRGAISITYGWALMRAGHTVHFLVRPEQRSKVYQDAVELDMLDCRGGLFGERVLQTFGTPFLTTGLPANHDYDLIVVSVQHWKFIDAIKMIAPNVGKQANVLILGNVWCEPDAILKLLPAGQVTWGFPNAGGGFRGPHFYIGSFLGFMTLGSLAPTPTAPTAAEQHVTDIFRSACFSVQIEPDFRGWLLAKFMVLGAMHAEALAAGTHVALTQHAHCKRVIGHMQELIPVLASRGVDPAGQRGNLGIVHCPPWLATILFKVSFGHFEPVRRPLVYASNPDEALMVCQDLVDEARSNGIPVPRTMECLDQVRQRGIFMGKLVARTGK